MGNNPIAPTANNKPMVTSPSRATGQTTGSNSRSEIRTSATEPLTHYPICRAPSISSHPTTPKPLPYLPAEIKLTILEYRLWVIFPLTDRTHGIMFTQLALPLIRAHNHNLAIAVLKIWYCLNTFRPTPLTMYNYPRLRLPQFAPLVQKLEIVIALENECDANADLELDFSLEPRRFKGTIWRWIMAAKGADWDIQAVWTERFTALRHLVVVVDCSRLLHPCLRGAVRKLRDSKDGLEMKIRPRSLEVVVKGSGTRGGEDEWHDECGCGDDMKRVLEEMMVIKTE
ncbi:hypothetical protein CC80DRAFT_555800 [Byssothecium circinans]|uniref:Uncharacterized protein n=1 Tax=Byssothecium circinans TaxID=147558 RepID=A0A6A5TBC9_9PLEO|nr:hypothetical protein CC80DRAFT_555800 [Byssothecium circinans]